MEYVMGHANAPKVTVVQPGGGETVRIPGFGATYKLYSRDNGGEVAMVEHPFPVGTITAPHQHTREDEHSIVLEGQIGFRSDDDEVVLGPGGYITKPRGQTHAMWNAGSVPGRIVEVITPGGSSATSGNSASCSLLAGQPRRARARACTRLTRSAKLATKYDLTYGNPAWLADVVARYGLNQPTH